MIAIPDKPAIRFPKLSVVIPAYNERPTIEEIISRVQAVDLDKEVIIIDDGSTDGTREFLTTLMVCANRARQLTTAVSFGRLCNLENIRVFLQEKRCGKGAAVRRGFQEARGAIVIIQDADLELDPQNYYRLIDPIDRGVANVVYGSRFPGKSRGSQPLSYYLGNRLLTVASNTLTGFELTDVWTGYKVFRREILQKISLQENRFGFEPEITAKLAKCGCKLVEVPVSYTFRGRDEGKKIRWKDGLQGLWCTLRYSLFRNGKAPTALHPSNQPTLD